MSSAQPFGLLPQSMFDPSQLPPAPWPQALTATNNHNLNHMAPMPVQQVVCHWQNCHQIFGTTNELLAHLASDHLHAPNALPLGGDNGSNMDSSMSMVPLQDFSGASQVNQQSFDFSNMQLDSAGVDSLMMACLWDNCFPPVQDQSTNPFSVNNQNGQMHPTDPSHSHAMENRAVLQQPTSGSDFAQFSSQAITVDQAQQVQAPSHSHTHHHSTGEPFSPQTMLRHVLEEHLGLSAGQMSWDSTMNPPPVPNSTPILPSQSSTATTPILTPQHPVKPHHHHIPILPTPSPSHYTASPPPITKPLICMWPGCTAIHPFLDTASLMVHLSEEHIGKCKNTYTCLWDTCGHAGGREFKSRQKVLRHLQSHIGHKPYICDVCDQAFSEAAPLAAHKRRHAQESKLVTARESICGLSQNRSNASIQAAKRLLRSLHRSPFTWQVLFDWK